MKKKFNKYQKIYIYYSDIAALLYYNYFKNIVNLCNHEKDFGLKTKWYFYPTYHGKSTCDGIGRMVKRLIDRISLQAVSSGHITTPI